MHCKRAQLHSPCSLPLYCLGDVLNLKSSVPGSSNRASRNKPCLSDQSGIVVCDEARHARGLNRSRREACRHNRAAAVAPTSESAHCGHIPQQGTLQQQSTGRGRRRPLRKGAAAVPSSQYVMSAGVRPRERKRVTTEPAAANGSAGGCKHTQRALLLSTPTMHGLFLAIVAVITAFPRSLRSRIPGVVVAAASLVASMHGTR